MLKLQLFHYYVGDKVVQGLEVCDSTRDHQCPRGPHELEPGLGHDDSGRLWSVRTPHVEAAGRHRGRHVPVIS